VGGVPAGEQVFLTHRAVTHVFSHLAIVISKELFVNAHSAVLAVTEVFATTNAAESAVRAVIGTFLIGHP